MRTRGGKSRFGSTGRSRRGRGRGGRVGTQRSDFKSSRIEGSRDTTASSTTDDGNDLPEENYATNEILEEGSESEEDTSNRPSSYGQLLQSLGSHLQTTGPSAKRRKLQNGSSEVSNASKPDGPLEHAPIANSSPEDIASGAPSEQTDSGNEDFEVDAQGPVDDEEEDEMGEADVTDPFESHFANPDSNLLLSRLKAIKDQRWISQSASTSQSLKQQYSQPSSGTAPANPVPLIQSLEKVKLKQRLVANGQKVWSELGSTEREVASSVFTYRDVLFGSRTLDNVIYLRDLVVLQSLNHVFKTRDRVIKNTSRLALEDTGETTDFRDQGFTRPKILFVLPTRQACARIIESIVRLSQPEQQENKSRFTEAFCKDDDDSWEDKPRDFQSLFGGNDDDMFRIGLKFTRKTVKFFSAFYNSDIILASPLGLRTAIETGGSKDGKKANDPDFLSSIEIVIMDHANALLMQNWQHVEYIFSQLNLLPKESHGCDFSRVRHWYLDGEAKYLRQTIVLTDFITPEINSIYTKCMLNIAGKVRYTPVYKGAMLDVSASLPGSITQTFLRLNVPTPASDADIRFSHFTSSILPALLKSKQEKGTLIFISSYSDFVRIRNRFSTSPTTASLSFGAISEYTSVRDVARARSHFLTGRQSVLLYSERAHHFRRYRLRGVNRIIFYSLPENPIFWSEVVAALNPGLEDGGDRGGRTVRALFSRWDVLKLERIVGTSRIGRMVHDQAGDTFEFM